MADITTEAVNDIKNKIAAILDPTVDRVKDKLFKIYNQQALLDISQELEYPCVGVAYEGMSPAPQDTSGELSEIACGVFLLLGDKADEANGRDYKDSYTSLLDKLRTAIHKTVAPAGYIWKFHAELPLDIDDRGLGYYQRFRTTAPTTGDVIGISGAVSLGGVQLPLLIFENEFAWVGVVASQAKTLGGPKYLQVQGAQWGQRPMDLMGTTEPSSFMPRSTLVQLLALAQAPNATYTLTYGSRTFTVRFRIEEPPVLSGVPCIPRISPEDADLYHSVRIKLMIIAETT